MCRSYTGEVLVQFVSMMNIIIARLPVLYRKREESLPRNILIVAYLYILERKGKVYATRKDACYDFAVTTVSNDSIWRYYNLNKNRIKKEELKAPQYKETVNGRKNNHGGSGTFSLLQDHRKSGK